MAGLLNATVDPRDAYLNDQVELARALRMKGMQGDNGQGYHGGRVYMVGNPWKSVIDTVGGVGLNELARSKQEDRHSDQQAQLAKFLRNRPSATQDKMVGVPSALTFDENGMPTVSASPTTRIDSVQKPWQQQQAEMNQWASGGMGIDSPIAQQIAAQGLQNSMQAPAEMAKLEQQAQDKKDLRELMAMRQQELQQQRLEAQDAMLGRKIESGYGMQDIKGGQKLDQIGAMGDVQRELQGVRGNQREDQIRLSGEQNKDLRNLISEAQEKHDKWVSEHPKVGNGKQPVNPVEQKQALSGQIDLINNSVDRLIDTDGKLKPGVSGIIGTVEQYRPDALMTDKQATAKADLEQLQQQITLLNLANQKKAAGQSFGSMQLKEWDKFMNQIANISRGVPEGRMAENLKLTKDVLSKHKDAIQEAISFAQGGDNTAAQPAPSVNKVMSDEDYDALPSGAVFIDPEGKKRTKP